MEALGIDVGGVIIAATNDKTDTSFFSENFLQSTAEPGVFDAIAQLSKQRFGQNMFIVSKCGPTVERKTLAWLEHHDFYARTGMPENHVYFTRTREGKAPIAAALQLTHFVDDRLSVLAHLDTVPHKFLFRGHPNEIRSFASLLPDVHHVESWADVQTALTPAVY